MSRAPMLVHRLLAASVLVVCALVLAAAPALAVTVPEPPTEPPVPLPTESPLPSEPPAPPEPSPSPQPEPSPTPTPQPDPTPDPAPTTSEAPATADPSPSATSSPVPAGGTSTGTILPDAPAPVPGGSGVEQPQVAPPSAGTTQLPTRTLLVTTADGLPGALGGVFILAFAAVLGGLASSFTTFTLTNRGALVARTLTGEIDMERTRRTRTILGVALLSIAGLIGVIGYLRISVETLVPVQIVYLASAGFGVVVFAIAGGSLLVAETLRSDEHRVRELESAVATLAGHLAGQVTDPPRLVDRGRADTSAVDTEDPDATPEAGGDDGASEPSSVTDMPPPSVEQPTTRIRTVRRIRRPDESDDTD